MTWMEWYGSLAKPSWTPAPSTISLIWMILYPVILLGFGFVFVKAFQRKLPRLVTLPFAVNLVANVLFMPPFAGCGASRWRLRTSWSSGRRSFGAWSPSGLTTAGWPSPRCRTSSGCPSPR